MIRRSALWLALIALPGYASPISESAIRIDVYRTLYANQGPAGELPKAFVFADDGRCVGVLVGVSTPASELWNEVEAALEASTKACDLVVSKDFPGARLESAVATGRPKVLLVSMREDFCRACVDYRAALIQGHASRQEIDIEIASLVVPSGNSG